MIRYKQARLAKVAKLARYHLNVWDNSGLVAYAKPRVRRVALLRMMGLIRWHR